MAAIEDAAYYANTRFDLLLSEDECSILKKLTDLAARYMSARLVNIGTETPKSLRDAADSLENLEARLMHIDGGPEKSIFLEGNAVVFLANPNNLFVENNPQFAAEYEFTHSDDTTQFIAKLQIALRKAHLGNKK
jgi:hypothetical protein